MEWKTPTRGLFTYESMLADIREKIEKDNDHKYKLIIGCDSHKSSTREGLKTKMVDSVILQRTGNGALYYYNAKNERYIPSLNQQIYVEASKVLVNTCLMNEEFQDLVDEGRLEIIPDVDIGPNGKTKELIKEVQGMFVSAGYPNVKIKPFSHASSAVADKYSR